MNSIIKNNRRLCVLFASLISFAASSSAALDPNAPPPVNFDLTHWNIALPCTTSGGLLIGLPAQIHNPEISDPSYYTHAPYTTTYAPYFFTDPIDGSMTFRVPWNGVGNIPLLGHPRSELRETHPDGTLYNWTTGSSDGIHTLTGVCTVDSDSVGATGQISIAQIHAKEPNIPAIMLYYDNSANNGLIRVKLKRKVTEFDQIDCDLTYVGLNVPGTNRTIPINYTLELLNNGAGEIRFVATVNGAVWDVKVSDFDANAWETSTFYFKAGCYYTNPVNGKTALVAYQYLLPSHGMTIP